MYFITTTLLLTFFYDNFYNHFRKSFGLCPSSLEEKEILNNRLNRGNLVLIYLVKKAFLT
jgi:hypothetical protein